MGANGTSMIRNGKEDATSLGDKLFLYAIALIVLGPGSTSGNAALYTAPKVGVGAEPSVVYLMVAPPVVHAIVICAG